MYSKGDSSITMIGKDIDEITQEHLDSLFQKYLEKSTKGSNFIFDYVLAIQYLWIAWGKPLWILHRFS